MENIFKINNEYNSAYTIPQALDELTSIRLTYGRKMDELMIIRDTPNNIM